MRIHTDDDCLWQFGSPVLQKGLYADNREYREKAGRYRIYCITDYYDADELKQEMEETVADYNAKQDSDSKAVSLKDFDYDAETQVLKARMVYQTYRDYASIHNCDFFVGTISEAGQNGYEWGDLKEVGTQSADEKGSDEDKSEQMVVICSEAVDVEVPGSVWYLSDNASVDASGIVTVGQSDGYSVIIYK